MRLVKRFGGVSRLQGQSHGGEGASVSPRFVTAAEVIIPDYLIKRNEKASGMLQMVTLGAECHWFIYLILNKY